MTREPDFASAVHPNSCATYLGLEVHKDTSRQREDVERWRDATPRVWAPQD